MHYDLGASKKKKIKFWVRFETLHKLNPRV
jgi:hypothetical protein